MGGSESAALFLLDPERDVSRITKALCQAHELTLAETDLAIRLAVGATISDAAQAMRIQPQTARSYLKQIFSKTDIHRQADLVRRMHCSVVRLA